MIDRLKTVQECRNLMTNATRLGRDDLRRAALRRCVELQAPTDPDPVIGGFGAMLAALEEVFRLRYGRALKANRTRAKAKDDGIMKVLIDWAAGHGQGTGFEMLIEEGLGDYTGEYVVAVNAKRFAADAVIATRGKLAARGISLPPGA
ncbi:hypothetical protein NLM16_09100 [Bradyrhizobium brasilense]|uniref:hypothetical protein n=1 Tax=Bradyrhizobium brasilense TaxID=1419277 RepID=UPI002877C836|nr:hypothetical protein [Bradyrhizobium brasilense]MCP3414255.1 hypothetical protein [Bradyrhizobium brasilense]